LKKKLENAIQQITAEHTEAVTRLALLQESIPALLSACAMGEIEANQLETTRAEIIRLQQVVTEPYQKAIEPLSARLKEFHIVKQAELSLQQAIQTETEYRKRFNRMMQEPSNSAAEWEWLHSQAESYHRKDVKQLQGLLSYFDTEGRGLTFMEYCQQQGFTSFNGEVTAENINRPRG